MQMSCPYLWSHSPPYKKLASPLLWQ